MGGAQVDQKTQVLSLEGVYRHDQRWEFAGKLARRLAQVRHGKGKLARLLIKRPEHVMGARLAGRLQRLDEPLGDRQLQDGGREPPGEPPICLNPASCE